MAKRAVKNARLKSLRKRNTEPDEVMSVVYRLCGTRDDTVRIAKTFLGLKVQYPRGTLPELIFLMILKKLGVDYVYQEDVRGGRSIYGGLVVDFFIPSIATACRIMGNYFHTRPDQVQRDEAQKTILLASVINGVQVQRVVDVWEMPLYSCNREAVVKSALNGVEWGRG